MPAICRAWRGTIACQLGIPAEMALQCRIEGHLIDLHHITHKQHHFLAHDGLATVHSMVLSLTTLSDYQSQLLHGMSSLCCTSV